MTHNPVDKPFKRRRILPAYQELLDSGALQGGTDSTQIIREDRDSSGQGWGSSGSANPAISATCRRTSSVSSRTRRTP